MSEILLLAAENLEEREPYAVNSIHSLKEVSSDIADYSTFKEANDTK